MAAALEFAAEGMVVGVQGPWGSGKSTLLNLVESRAKGAGGEGPLVVRFNPWWFAGREDLYRRFFAELGASLGRQDAGRLQEIGRRLRAFAEAVKPLKYVLVPGSEALATAVADFANATATVVGAKAVAPTLDELRDQIAADLAAAGRCGSSSTTSTASSRPSSCRRSRWCACWPTSPT